MQPYQQRVIEEERDLSEKLKKLSAFIEGSQFGLMPDGEKALLQEQAEHMRAYVIVLKKRIELF